MLRNLTSRDFNSFFKLADGQTQGKRITNDVPVFPEGQVTHPEYGDLDFSYDKLKSYVRHFDDKVRKIEICVDIDHKNEDAVGWVQRVYYRPDNSDQDAGLFADVEWNRKGQELLADKRYRYISPQFGDYTDERTGEKYDNVLIALTITNFPFLKDMPAIKLRELAQVPAAARPMPQRGTKPTVAKKPAPGMPPKAQPGKPAQGQGQAQPEGSGFDTTPLEQLDLQNLPRQSFLIPGMPDDPRTWKLPIKDSTGTPNLHAIMAAHAVAHGAGGTQAPQVSQEIHDQLHTFISQHEKASAAAMDAAQNPQAAQGAKPAQKAREVGTHRQRLADGERILRELSLKDRRTYMKATRSEFIKNTKGGDPMARAKKADDDELDDTGDGGGTNGPLDKVRGKTEFKKARRTKKADDDEASRAKRADDDELDDDSEASELDDDAEASELDDDELDDDGDTLKKGKRAKKAKQADDDNEMDDDEASKAKKAYDEDEAWDKTDMQPFEKNSKQEVRRVPKASPPSGPGKNMSETVRALAENIRKVRALEMRLREKDVKEQVRSLSEHFRLTVDKDAEGEAVFAGKFAFARPVLRLFRDHALADPKVGKAILEVLAAVRKDGIVDLTEHGRGSDPEDAENDIMGTVKDVTIDRKLSDKYAVEGANHVRAAQAYAKSNGLDWKKADDQLVAFEMTDPRKTGKLSESGYGRK